MKITTPEPAFQKIYKLVRSIPSGKVCTYGQIAKKLGVKSPRIIGFALHRNPDQKTIPCHRVVNAKGEISKNFAFGGEKAQRLLLEKEGIKLSKDTVDLERFQCTDL